MRDRHLDGETAHPRGLGRAPLLGIPWARVAAGGLVTAGSALMAVATVGGPSMKAGSVTLADQPTLLPLPIVGECGNLSLPIIVTTVTLPDLTCTATHSSMQTSSDEQPGTVESSTSAAATAPGSASNTVGQRASVAPTGSATPSVATSRSASSTAVGVLGANTGTPSTGTDIAFGIGIGLVIAGAGIGTGTAEFFKRRRTTP